MSDEELKAMAEKAVTKMVIIQQRILDETTKDMSEEEIKFYTYIIIKTYPKVKKRYTQ